LPFYLIGEVSSNPVYIIQLNVYVECMSGKGTLGSLLETLLIPGSSFSDDKCLRNESPHLLLNMLEGMEPGKCEGGYFV
jgi:hypothetical protein